jgi:hypothetical protein
LDHEVEVLKAGGRYNRNTQIHNFSQENDNLYGDSHRIIDYNDPARSSVTRSAANISANNLPNQGGPGENVEAYNDSPLN